MSQQITQLVVACPEEMCHHESQLGDKAYHLRLCGKTSVECPFTEFGCDNGKLEMNMLNEHLQREGYRHNGILIAELHNMRKELTELKQDREKYGEAIDKLIKSDRDKDVIINLMKLENAAMEHRMNKLSSLLGGKIGHMVTEIDMKLEEMRREWRGAIEQQQSVESNPDEGNEVRCRRKIAKKSDAMDTCLELTINNDIVMIIDNIAEKRQKRECIFSEPFTRCSQPYNMRLDCFCDIDDLMICFCINRGKNDESLQWPFDRNVTITITNKMSPNARKSITEHHIIAKKDIGFYSLLNAFEFQWDELANEGLLIGNCLTVRCSIGDE